MMHPVFRSIDHLAVWLLARARLPLRPPRARIEQLAAELGSRRILYEDLDYEDGRLEVRDREIVIALSSRLSEARRNFTLAHEVAHLVLVQPDLRLAPLRRRWGLEDEERFCDELAGALLMPAPWILRFYGRRPQTLFNLRDCAQEAETSLSATTIRLARVVSWQRMLLRWRRSKDNWRLLSTAGHNPGLGTSLRSTTATCELMEDLQTLCTGYRNTWLPLQLRGRPVEIRAEVHVSGCSGVALIDFARIRVRAPRSSRASSGAFSGHVTAMPRAAADRRADLAQRSRARPSTGASSGAVRAQTADAREASRSPVGAEQHQPPSLFSS
jgi:Zn-dependent peptidase ImmA (M78 family)